MSMQLRAGDYQTAAEALCLQEPYSDSDLNEAADRYETAHGIPLIRPHEAGPDGAPNGDFEKRLKKFNFKAAETGLAGDPEVHRKELRKLLDILKRKGAANLSQRERAAIHENQKALGMPLSDFTVVQRTSKEIAKAAEQAYLHIQKHSTTYIDRLAAIKSIDDMATLQLFAEMDKSEEVREAAMERIKALEMAQIPE